MLGLERLSVVIKSMIYIPILGLTHCFLSVKLFLCSKKPEAKSKYFSERLFSEIFGKSFLLGVISRYQRP